MRLMALAAPSNGWRMPTFRDFLDHFPIEGMSSGLRQVTRPSSTTTSWSAQ
jgi:hypothetical protein